MVIVLKILYDLSLYGIPQLGANQKNVLIVSEADGENSISVLVKIVRNLFRNKGFVFEASGLPENLKSISESLVNRVARYHEGDSNKFFIRKYPECICFINYEQVAYILTDCWSNAIHERRRIFILDKAKLETFAKTFDETSFSDYLLAKKSWEYVDMIIENVLDDPRNSFIVICKKNLWEKAISSTAAQGTVDGSGC